VILAGILSGPGGFALAGWSVMSTGVAGLALDWYAIGLGSPRLIGVFELLPKAIGSVISAGLALIGLGVVWYPILVSCSTLVGLMCFHMSCWRRPLPPVQRMSVLRNDLKDHLSAWLIEVTGNAYSSAPAPIAAAFEKAAVVAQYSSGDKLYRYSLMVLIALGNSLQGWVLSVSGRALLGRQRIAVLVHLLVGSGGLLCFVIFGQWATALLFGSKVQSSRLVGIWLGVAFFAISVSTPFIRNILVPARRERLVLNATVLGAVVGLGLMVLGAQVWGAAGVAAALATSELVTAVITGVASAPYLLGYARVHVNPRPETGSLKTDAGDR
jgi:PST family polysaccharide transporter